MSNECMFAIQSALKGQAVFCKFLTANDTGSTGAHQSGIYISKPSISILFDKPGVKGENKEKRVKVKWHDDFETETRFIYYGQGTRNEYRITNFGRGFPFLRPEYTGALFVFVKCDADNYQGYVLNTEEDINQFLDTFGISPTETNRIIETRLLHPEEHEEAAIEAFISTLTVDFPSSEEMSAAARRIHDTVFDHRDLICTDPDSKLLDWTDTEFRLFRALEYARYREMISNGFVTVEDFIAAANQVLNRRKSRAGKSLEHHLSAIFEGNGLQYEEQAITEGSKKPDFLFPSQEAYHNPAFPVDRLVSLAAKTTCKDRWRQVINEANRLRGKNKFLCTLQQGVSAAQMDEMQSEHVILVVPKPYIATYPKDRQDRILTLDKFIGYVREIEGL